MANEYSSTIAAEDDKEVAAISDSEGEDDSIVENFDGSPHITLPAEVWANVINCEYCNMFFVYIFNHIFIMLY